VATGVPLVILGDRITAVNEILIATAVGEAQTVLNPQSYKQSIASNQVGGDNYAGFALAWPAFNGYSSANDASNSRGSGVGNFAISVPATGAYLASLTMQRVANGYGHEAGTPRTIVELYFHMGPDGTTNSGVLGNLFAHNNAQLGDVENVVTCSGITPVLAAGSLIIPIRLMANTASTAWDATATLSIAPIPYLP
jgi:hypothetical protein